MNTLSEIVIEAWAVVDMKIVWDRLYWAVLGIVSLGDVLLYALADNWYATVHACA